MSGSARDYGGVSAQERTSARRERLLEAGLELFGTPGGERVTMTAICSEARLTERYFYESFRDRDELLLEVVERIADEVRHKSLAALEQAVGEPDVRARAAVAAFVEILTTDPRKGHVAMVASAAVEPFRTRRRQLLHRFARMVAEESKLLYGDRAWSSPQDEVAALLFVGGLAELVTAWLSGDIEVAPEMIVEAATYQFTATAHR
jgi:AcrR family transcriptional regulator